MNPFRIFLLTLAVCGAIEAQPKIAWSKYLAGGWSDVAEASIVDADGNIWVTGSTNGKFDADGPNDAYQKTNKGKTDVYLAKYRPEPSGGQTLLFFTWLGGTGDDKVRAMALDSRGRVYLTGVTDSTDFPRAGETFQVDSGGAKDVFIAVIDPSIGGDLSLAFSSYYGGSGDEEPTAIAVDPTGKAVIVGFTSSENLPSVSGNAQPVGRGGVDAFLIRVNPNGAPQLDYATYYGGAGIDIATGVGVAPNGRIWFSGYTSSSDFPVSGASYQPTPAPGFYDGFLVEFDLNQSGLGAIQYGTYFGGNFDDVPTTLKIDAAGRVWIAGHTTSWDLPNVHGVQGYLSGGSDAFIARFDVDQFGTVSLGYSTYFGGLGYETLYGLAIQNDGKVSISGYQMFGNMPTTPNAIQPNLKSAFADAFIATIDPTISGSTGITYSSYLGGSLTDVATSISAGADGSLVVTGYTLSSDFPTTDGSQRINPGGLTTAFITKITQQ